MTRRLGSGPLITRRIHLTAPALAAPRGNRGRPDASRDGAWPCCWRSFGSRRKMPSLAAKAATRPAVAAAAAAGDRTRVVEGKRMSVRVDLVGTCPIQKYTNQKKQKK